MTKKKNRSVISEDSAITFLNQYFASFEDNLKRNNFAVMNTRLACVIIDKFKKLFELWDENIILERSIKSKLFEDVFSLMKNVFSENSNDTDSICSSDSFILECKRCGDEFPLRNGNCRYSYNYHKASPEHQQFIENLNDEDESTNSCVADKPDTRKALGDEKLDKKSSKKALKKRCDEDSRNGIINAIDGNGSSSDESVKCIANLEKSSSLKAKKGMKISMYSSSGQIMIKDSDVNFLEFRDFTMVCKLCDVKLPSTKKIFLHMNTDVHFKMRNRLRLNEKYLKMGDYSVQCILCNTVCLRLHSFLKHCENSVHRVKVNGLSGYHYSRYLRRWNDSMVDLLTEEFHCNICMISIIGIKEVFKHFKVTHRIKL